MTRVFTSLATSLVFLASLFLLAGCGGGGASGTPAATTGAGGSSAQPTVVVALVDPSSGAARNSVSVGNPMMARATVRDATGQAVVGSVVTFNVTPSGQVNLTPAVGTALTDASGVASVQIDPAGITSAGAATITAAATVGSAANATPITGSVSFSIVAGQQPTITLSLTDPTSGAPRTSIRVGSPATATATVRDSAGVPVANTIVTFAANPTGQVAFTPAAGTAVTDSNGVATAQVDPAGLTASGAVTITATAQVSGATIAGSSNLTITVSAGTQQQVTVTLTNPTSNAAVTSISLGNPAKASATVLDANGRAVPNAVVTFTAVPSAQVAITPASGTALTNAQGVAFVQIDPASLSSSGAATITASAAVGSSTVTGSTSFSIGAASLGLSGLTTALGQAPLSPYGTTSATVSVTGVPSTTPVTVNFSSTCSGSGKAILPASVLSVNGVATATYKDNGCGQTDRITASIAGTSVSATTNLVVQAPGAASLQFISATPTTIVIRGTGGAGLSESSIVVFKVVDNNNQPIPNASVSLNLTTLSGGILLDGTSTLPLTKQTDANGLVQVAVQSGTNPTAVWVTASASNGTLNSQSTVLQISTGRPAQDRFSLSVTTLNIEGWQYDGTTTTLTARASDRVGNPVPDGTAINFISEGAQVQPGCVTAGGACSAVFTSAEFRPRGDSEPSHTVTAGRVTVLAYAVGEESFTDTNGNNRWDLGEPFNDLGDVYIDNKEDRTWVSGEQFVPFGASGNCAAAGIASSAAAPSKPSSCDGTWGSAHVRRDIVIILSGSDAFVAPTTLPMAAACSKGFALNLRDINNNPMPAGTTLSTSNPSPGIKTAAVVAGSPVASTNAAGGTGVGLLVEMQIPGGGDCVAPNLVGGSFVLRITTPKGNTSAYTMTVTP